MKYAILALAALLMVPAVSEAKTRISIGVGIGWSSGGTYVNTGTYYSSGGYYGGYCGPRYCAPPVVVYQPAPVYYVPPPVYYAPAPTYYYAPRVYYGGGYYRGGYCR